MKTIKINSLLALLGLAVMAYAGSGPSPVTNNLTIGSNVQAYSSVLSVVGANIPAGTIIVVNGDSISTHGTSDYVISTTTISGSAIVAVGGGGTNTANAHIYPGQVVTGTGIPANTKVLWVDGDTIHATLSRNATVSATNTLTFTGSDWPTELGKLPVFSGNSSIHNFASGGTNIANAVTSYNSNVHGILDPVSHPVAGRAIWMGCLGGNDFYTNDPFVTIAALESLWTTIKADGFEVWAFTVPNKGYGGLPTNTKNVINFGGGTYSPFILTSGDTSTSAQQILNELIRNDSIPDHVIDIEAGIETNAADRVHPSLRGIRTIAERAALAIMLGGIDPRSAKLHMTISSITAAYGQGLVINAPNDGQGVDHENVGLVIKHPFTNLNTASFSSEVDDGLVVHNDTTTGSSNEMFGPIHGIVINNRNFAQNKADTMFGLEVNTGDANGGGVGQNAGIHINTPGNFFNSSHITTNDGIRIESQQPSGVGGITGTTLAINVVDPTDTVQFGIVKAAGQIISSVATSTAPFVVASTTNVANLNASSLNGATFAAPGVIGSTPSAATFTTLTATTAKTLGNTVQLNNATRTAVELGSAQQLGWTNNAAAGSGTQDTWISRNSAGVVGIGATSAGIDGALDLGSVTVVGGTLTMFNGATIAHNGTAGIGILGGTDGNTAFTGYVGETPSPATVAVGSAVSLTTNTPANVTSKSLGAGNWIVWGVVYFNQGATTTSTYYSGGIGTTTATLPGYAGAQASIPGTAATITGYTPSVTIPPTHILLNATTTIYMVAQSGFLVSTQAAYGNLNFLRIN